MTALYLGGIERELSEAAYVVLGSVDYGEIEQETVHLLHSQFRSAELNPPGQ